MPHQLGGRTPPVRFLFEVLWSPGRHGLELVCQCPLYGLRHRFFTIGGKNECKWFATVTSMNLQGEDTKTPVMGDMKIRQA
jgi:hypothetical protein